jgi:cation diffusion facilitator family transporter
MAAAANDKTKFIRIASIIALAGNTALAALKIGAGFLTGSAALIGDGIDSSSDVLISVITLAVVGIIAKPADKEHPWGHGRAEIIATAFLSFALFFMGGQLILTSALKLISGGATEAPSAAAAIAALISIAGKLLLAWSQRRLGDLADSPMIRANAKNMASDVLLSAGVLVGLIVSNFMASGLADAVITVLIGGWIIRTAIGIFLETSLELMDGGKGMESYQVIFDAVHSVPGAGNPHRARMRHIAGFWDIDLDIEVDPELTVSEAHDIATRVEKEIKSRLENVFDVMVHVEPRDDDASESFGLSEAEL